MLAVTADGTWQATPPRRIAGNPTGAGDSAVAGLLSGLVEDLPWPDRLTRAVALSAATVRAPAAGEFDTATYEELLPRVVVTDHPSAAVKRTGRHPVGGRGPGPSSRGHGTHEAGAPYYLAPPRCSHT